MPYKCSAAKKIIAGAGGKGIKGNDFMDERQLINNMIYLLTKYLRDRNDLAELIQQDSDSVKYILSEIDKKKQLAYDDADLALIKEISFYFL